MLEKFMSCFAFIAALLSGVSWNSSFNAIKGKTFAFIMLTKNPSLRYLFCGNNRQVISSLQLNELSFRDGGGFWSGQLPKSTAIVLPTNRKIRTIWNIKDWVGIIFLYTNSPLKHSLACWQYTLNARTTHHIHSSYLILLPNDGFYLPPADTFYAPPALYVFSTGLLSVFAWRISLWVECLANHHFYLFIYLLKPPHHKVYLND